MKSNVDKMKIWELQKMLEEEKAKEQDSAATLKVQQQIPVWDPPAAAAAGTEVVMAGMDTPVVNEAEKDAAVVELNEKEAGLFTRLLQPEAQTEGLTSSFSNFSEDLTSVLPGDLAPVISEGLT